MRRTITALVGGLILSVWVVSSASAKTKPSSTTPQSSAETQQQKAGAAAQQAHDQAVTDAQTALTNAQADLNAVVVKAQSAFQGSPEYVAANSELTSSQAAYAAASTVVKGRVDATPEFADAKAKSDKSQAELADAKANSGTTDDEMLAVAQAALNTSSAAHKIEADAIAADPTASSAMDKVVAAQKSIDALNADFHQKVTQTPDYIAAKKAVDAAEKNLIAVENSRAAKPTAAGKSIRGKITAIVSNTSFKMSVPGSKIKILIVNYTNSVTLTGVASGLIDKTTIGETATVVGDEKGSAITATSITISGTPKATGN